MPTPKLTWIKGKAGKKGLSIANKTPLASARKKFRSTGVTGNASSAYRQAMK